MSQYDTAQQLHREQIGRTSPLVKEGVIAEHDAAQSSRTHLKKALGQGLEAHARVVVERERVADHVHPVALRAVGEDRVMPRNRPPVVLRRGLASVTTRHTTILFTYLGLEQRGQHRWTHAEPCLAGCGLGRALHTPLQ